jgi:succinate dehydrogenase / fumarate reductase cytochrome b subunit
MKHTKIFSRYRMNFQVGMFSYMMHRITGIMLLASGLVLLLSMGLIHFGAVNFDRLMVFYRLPAMRIVSSVFLMALWWHLLNGIRILIIDFLNAAGIQRLLGILVNTLFIAGAVLYYIYIFPQ